MEEKQGKQEKTKEKKPKTWDEAINELQGFILKTKKEEAKQKEEVNQIKES